MPNSNFLRVVKQRFFTKGQKEEEEVIEER